MNTVVFCFWWLLSSFLIDKDQQSHQFFFNKVRNRSMLFVLPSDEFVHENIQRLLRPSMVCYENFSRKTFLNSPVRMQYESKFHRQSPICSERKFSIQQEITRNYLFRFHQRFIEKIIETMPKFLWIANENFLNGFTDVTFFQDAQFWWWFVHKSSFDHRKNSFFKPSQIIDQQSIFCLQKSRVLPTSTECVAMQV